MEALLEGGADALLIETIFDTLNAKAAIFAAGHGDGNSRVFMCPLMLSVTVSDIEGRTLLGQTWMLFSPPCNMPIFFQLGLTAPLAPAS